VRLRSGPRRAGRQEVGARRDGGAVDCSTQITVKLRARDRHLSGKVNAQTETGRFQEREGKHDEVNKNIKMIIYFWNSLF